MNETRVLVIKATDPDATLVEQHEAFGKLVGAFQDMAYACAYAVLGDFQLAEDAAQEAFVSAWQKLSQLRQPEAFPGWFRRIVLTECNRLTRRKHLPATALDESANLAPALDDPQAMLEREVLKKTVFTAIGSLPDNERVVVSLFYLKEYSQSEISAFLEVPTTTIAKRLYSARTRLRGKMTKEFKDDLAGHRPSRSRTFEEKVAAGIFNEYIGEYIFELRPELTVHIKRQGNKLISEAGGQRNELFAEGDSESELFTREFDGKGRFLRDRKGRITHFVYYEFGKELGLAEKIG